MNGSLLFSLVTIYFIANLQKLNHRETYMT